MKDVGSTEVDRFLNAAKGGFTMEELQAAFDLVKDEEHWKNPIDRIIDRDRMKAVDRAIPWFTGTSPSFEDVADPTKVRVVADGYFMGPCN